MKVLYVYDHVFFTKDGVVYSNTFSYAFLRSYGEVFSQITVVARSLEVKSTENLSVASGRGVRFAFFESIANLSSFFGRRKRHQAAFEQLAAEHEGVIVRLPSEFGLLAVATARRLQKKILIEVVGCAWDAMWNYGGLRAKLYAPFLYFRMKRAVKQADFVTYDTEKFLQKRYAASKNATKIAIADVRLDEMREAVIAQRIRKIEAAAGTLVFGTIGSMKTKYKGIDTAIKALALIARQGADFEYRILGSGDQEKYRRLAEKHGIAERVKFDGVLPVGEAVYHWLDRIDIYMQPSLAEALSRSLIEAMSRGCPAIGSSVGGVPEVLDEKMLVTPGSTKELARKAASLMRDSRAMREAALRNFKTARRYQASELDAKRRGFYEHFRDTLKH